ncbi:MAG: PQQ-binding-like beta-propeller repeat protein [Gammaproteobacteria bacterium]|nr:PQQ-binding-like beta-propeller repeat protein [Gammaproteobacteria bacterium]MDH5693617.1 PQQ-binding-like beta-propeller repeat protein [Gammaproteobacteria bacterium]
MPLKHTHLIPILLLLALGACSSAPPKTDEAPAKTEAPATKQQIHEPSQETVRPEPVSEPDTQQETIAEIPPFQFDSGLPSTGLPQFRGNNTHTYYGTGPFPATEPEVVWKFKTDVFIKGKKKLEWQGLGWTGQPAVVQEDVEGEKRWVVYLASLDGNLYKLDLLTGRLLLKSKENYTIFKSSPTVTDKYVLAGSWNNKEHIFDRYTFEEVGFEEAVYTKSASYDFDGSARVEDGFIYIGGEDGYIRKLSATPPFTRQWIYPLKEPSSRFKYKNGKPYVGIESSIAIYKDIVIVGSGSGYLIFVDKNTGKLLHKFDTGDDTDASPVVDEENGFVYIGVEKDNSDKPGGVYKLNMKAEVQWFFEVGKEGVYGTPALRDDKLFVPGDDSFLYCLDTKTGEKIWRQRLPDSSWSSPVVIDDKVMIGDYAGYLSAFSTQKGYPVWQKKFDGYIVSTPAVWNGIIVVGSRDGYIYALADQSRAAAMRAHFAKNSD